MRIVVTDRARHDLLRTYRYLVERNPIAADAVVHRIDRKIQQLRHFPFIGRQRSSLARGVRSVVVGMPLIANEQPTVVRSIDGRMDIDAEFRK
jgi:plasmid stabilization system protein ParE